MGDGKGVSAVPGGGDRGGQVIACGTPEEVIKVKESYTGEYLIHALK